MKPGRAIVPLLAVFGIVTSGCGDRLHRLLQPQSVEIRQLWTQLRGNPGMGRLSAVGGGMRASAGVPPSVVLTSPIPSTLLAAVVPPEVTIRWSGFDPDGIFTTHPVKYKYRLISQADPSYAAYLSDPDSLRKAYEPAFAGWDSTSGDTTSVRYTNLIPGTQYLFAVVGFDESGLDNQPFSFSTNLVRMNVVPLGTNGPQLLLSDEFFSYGYPAGGISTAPAIHPHVQLPADRALSFQWAAQPLQGTVIAGYRWALDLADVYDETPRANEQTDLAHWSAWSATAHATVGPFSPPGVKREAHRFYVEARDNNGLVSLGIVFFSAERPTPAADLLIVDDTRLRPDQGLFFPDPLHPDSVQAPTGPWPTAAELDTFLYARGGVRWRYYPDGTVSGPGIFAGYHYDTLGTRFVPGGVVPLSVLTQYRHVIWYADYSAAVLGGGTFPITALRAMSSPSQQNALALYVQQGGSLWLLGGGSGMASTFAWDCTGNNASPWFTFSALPCGGRLPELAPGRLMYDVAHWRSQFSGGRAANTIVRSSRAVGGWPGAPDYSQLPAAMSAKSPGTDPLPPLRASSDFYNSLNRLDIEYLGLPDTVFCENAGGTPKLCVPAFDTLFTTSGASQPVNPGGNPCMTYYHGVDNGPLLFSGFNLWNFQRAACIQLADFVLQELWGLPRDPVARTPATGPMALRPRR